MLPGTPRTPAGLAALHLLSRQLDADVFLLGVEVEGPVAAFAADAAFLHAAEGDAQVADEPAVDPDGAGVDGAGDAVGTAQVVGPDHAGQAVPAVVGQTDGLV